MGGISIKDERNRYQWTYNNPNCRVRIKRIWTQTEIDQRQAQKQMVRQIGYGR